MKVAFVGMPRPMSTVTPSYIDSFMKYHLELPWYFAEHGKMDVVLTVKDDGFSRSYLFGGGGTLRVISESEWRRSKGGAQAVVHWRSYRPDLESDDCVNILHTCDHTYPEQWKQTVQSAYDRGRLGYISAYETWHVRQVSAELPGIPQDRFLIGITLGVDTDVYRPIAGRDPFKMLWASDPGRGLQLAVEVTAAVWNLDRRFRLHVCYPDYCPKPNLPRHPAFVDHGNLKAGDELWDLWNSCSILPYSSTFPEPSCRCHRQSQASGMVVLYPPKMGTPSELIDHGVTGLVLPISEWPRALLDVTREGYPVVSSRARKLAEDESWPVQSQRFYETVYEIAQGRQPPSTWKGK